MTEATTSNRMRSLLEMGVLLAALFLDLWWLRVYDNTLLLAPPWSIALAAYLLSYRRRRRSDHESITVEGRPARAWIETSIATAVIGAVLLLYLVSLLKR